MKKLIVLFFISGVLLAHSVYVGLGEDIFFPAFVLIFLIILCSSAIICNILAGKEVKIKRRNKSE